MGRCSGLAPALDVVSIDACGSRRRPQIPPLQDPTGSTIPSAISPRRQQRCCAAMRLQRGRLPAASLRRPPRCLPPTSDTDRYKPDLCNRQKAQRDRGVCRIVELGTAVALAEDRLIEQPPALGVVRIVVDPALLVLGFEVLCRDYRLPEKDRMNPVFTRQQSYQPQIG